MAELLQRCHTMAPPARAHARRQPTTPSRLEAARAAPLSALGNQAAQRALSGEPRHGDPAEELEQGKSSCGCGASKAAPHGWMGAPPRHCGIAAEAGGGGGGGGGAEGGLEYMQEQTSEEAVGDYDLGLGTEEEYAVGKARPPHQGGATIKCDGKDGYKPVLGSWGGKPCGISAAVTVHEQSHVTDWLGRWPDGCKGKKDGDAIPTGGDGYAAFLNKSECDAHQAELNYVAGLIAKEKNEDCKTKLKAHEELTKKQREAFSC